jgi:pimeloyl-ACP methyl ester carboxylesterase
MIKIKPKKSSTLFLLPVVLIIIISGFVINYKKFNPEPIGKLIDIGGYRLHIIKKGQGTPAVILISGAKAFSFDWYFIQDNISKFTTVCSYDRPGLAWSDPGPEPRTFNQDVYELHELLLRSHIFPPYIMVGHSLGGIIARKYIKEYPNDVVGLVLVDATSENNFLFMNNRVSRLRDFATSEQLPKIKTKIDSLTIIPSGSILSEYRKSYGEPEIGYPLTLLPNSIQKMRLWAMGLPKYYIADN